MIRLALDRIRGALGKDTRRLADGTPVRLGLRVVFDRAVLTKWGLGHAYDESVHEITSLLGGDCHLVELGPRQEGVGALRRAPRGSVVTCGQCARWPETLRKIREQNAAYRARRGAA